MTYALITRIIILLIIFIVAGWDLFLLWNIHFNDMPEAQEATFSVVLYEAARRWPVIPFIFGFLCGHVFWQIYSKKL